MIAAFARQLEKDVFESSYGWQKTIFLCGKALDDKTSIRAKIAESLGRRYFYRIVYPEELFEELLAGPVHNDLLSLENVLAESVDAVVLVPESYGAVAELGAFTDHPELRKKLVVVQDVQFKKAKSFINYGPLRLLRDRKIGKVVTFDVNELDKGIEDIEKAIKRVAKASSKKSRVNVINCDLFLLAGIYLLEPVSKLGLNLLVEHASEFDVGNTPSIVSAGLSVLQKRGLIERATEGISFGLNTITWESEGFRLSAKGLEEIRRKKISSVSSHGKLGKSSALDRLRIEVLHMTCRGKKMRGF